MRLLTCHTSKEQHSTSNTPAPLNIYVKKSLVLPLIIYCSSIWPPYHQNYIDKLESVQHKHLWSLAMKSGCPMLPIDHNYDDLCSQFNIPYLRQIHYLHDATFQFKFSPQTHQ